MISCLGKDAFFPSVCTNRSWSQILSNPNSNAVVYFILEVMSFFILEKSISPVIFTITNAVGTWNLRTQIQSQHGKIDLSANSILNRIRSIRNGNNEDPDSITIKFRQLSNLLKSHRVIQFIDDEVFTLLESLHPACIGLRASKLTIKEHLFKRFF